MQAALNLLREERRAVIERLAAIEADAGLRADDGAHWRQLRSQARLEIGQIGRAIDVLERIEGGALREVEGRLLAAPPPPPGPRQTGLRARPDYEGRA